MSLLSHWCKNIQNIHIQVKNKIQQQHLTSLYTVLIIVFSHVGLNHPNIVHQIKQVTTDSDKGSSDTHTVQCTSSSTLHMSVSTTATTDVVENKGLLRVTEQITVKPTRFVLVLISLQHQYKCEGQLLTPSQHNSTHPAHWGRYSMCGFREKMSEVL